MSLVVTRQSKASHLRYRNCPLRHRSSVQIDDLHYAVVAGKSAVAIAESNGRPDCTKSCSR